LMPRGGNRYDQYEAKRRTDGRLCLDSKLDEHICSLLADNEPAEEIIKLLAEQAVTLEQIAALKERPLAQRRIGWLRKKNAREDQEPKTADECLAFVKSKLVELSKTATEDKSRIDALKALASVAIDERKNPSVVPSKPAVGDLNSLIGGGQ
jgi:hypothetical protein